jgi:ParB family transcriptional regulator, chromosome partitioning protein
VPQEQIQDVEFVDIEMIPMLRKSAVDQEKLAGLMRSIEEVGLLYPPRLTREGEKYLPTDGFHRLLAMMKLGKKSTPAIIEEKPLNEGQKLQKGLIADAHRIDLTPLERGEGIARLMEITGWNGSSVAGRLGISGATVSKLLKILQLPEGIKQQVHDGQIGFTAALELLKEDDSDIQAALATEVAAGRLTRDALAGSLKAKKNGRKKHGGSSSRVTARLGSGRVVTVIAESIDLETFIEALEEALAKARKARTSGVEISTFTRMLRDQASV